MQKKLSIECVNRVKIEKIEEFRDSIFEDVYDSAASLVTRIVEENALLAEGEDEAENFCNGNAISNVIAFVGERGMGKSSAMLSFAYYLKQYGGKNEYAEFCTLPQGVSFCALEKIDAGSLVRESLFDVVLAEMWGAFCSRIEEIGSEGFLLNTTKDRFNQVKNAYNLYYQSDEKLRSLTTVRKLQELSRSLQLRSSFAELVSAFLKCMTMRRDKDRKKPFLVLAIDDLDMAGDDALTILDQMRVFLSVPQVVVLTTVNIDKLLLTNAKKYSEMLLDSMIVRDYEKGLVRTYANQYIAKVLPANNRIYMPRYSGINGERYILDYETYVKPLLQRENADLQEVNVNLYISMIAAKYLNLILTYKEDIIIRETQSLRSMVNTLNEVWHIYCRSKDIERLFEEWLDKEIFLTVNRVADEGEAAFAYKLLAAQEEHYNEYIIEYVLEEEGSSYGQMLCALAKYKSDFLDTRSWMLNVILLYSARVARCVKTGDERHIEECFVKGRILPDLFMGVTGNMSSILQYDLQYDDRNAMSIIVKNREVILHMYKVLLFFKLDKLLENETMREVSDANDSAQIPLPEGEQKPFGEAAGDRETVRKIVRLRMGRGVFGRASADRFFSNIVRCRELFAKYLKWIYAQIAAWTGEAAEDAEINELLETHFCQDNSFLAAMDRWKADNKIGNVYDILPIQNVGVMAEVAGKVEALKEKQGWPGHRIPIAMKRFEQFFCETFMAAEARCQYESLGYISFSKKMKELMEAVRLADVPAEVWGRIMISGRKLEELTPGA